MEQQDLLVSMTIDQDFPGKASHCNMFFLSRSVELNSGWRRNIMAKTPKAKVKAKPAPKRFKAENVPLKNRTLRN